MQVKQSCRNQILGPKHLHHPSWTPNVCRAKKLRPVCGSNIYKDKACWSNCINKFWSYPSHDHAMGIPLKRVRNLFFYTKYKLTAMYNTGTKSRWARGWKKGEKGERGYTLCEVIFKSAACMDVTNGCMAAWLHGCKQAWLQG